MAGLIGCNTAVTTTNGIEKVLPGIADPSREAEEEPLSRYNVNRIDHRVSVHIRGGQPATREWRSHVEEMPLDGDYVNGIDARGTWGKGRHSWCHGVVPTGGDRRQSIVPGAVGRGRTSAITGEGERYTADWVKVWV